MLTVTTIHKRAAQSQLAHPPRQTRDRLLPLLTSPLPPSYDQQQQLCEGEAQMAVSLVPGTAPVATSTSTATTSPSLHPWTVPPSPTLFVGLAPLRGRCGTMTTTEAIPDLAYPDYFPPASLSSSPPGRPMMHCNPRDRKRIEPSSPTR
jgi:hypothetical protein